MLSLKDRLIDEVALSLEIENDIVDQVINWVYKKTVDLMCGDLTEVELNGFGRLRVSPTKVKKQIHMLEHTKYNYINNEANLEKLRMKYEKVKRDYKK